MVLRIMVEVSVSGWHPKIALLKIANSIWWFDSRYMQMQNNGIDFFADTKKAVRIL